MRQGELLELDWSRADLSRGVVALERTKSGKRREVPMRQAVYAIFAAMPEPRVGRVWPDKSIRAAFENAVKAAGLVDFTFHGCRHHLASWFMMRGGQLEALREIRSRIRRPWPARLAQSQHMVLKSSPRHS